MYTYNDYKNDLDQLLKAISLKFQVADTKNDEDAQIFINDLKSLQIIATYWSDLAQASNTFSLMKAGAALQSAYTENKFSTGDFFPGVQGELTLNFAKEYLLLLKKALEITPPQVGNFLTQPLINAEFKKERADTERCILALDKLIKEYKPKSTSKMDHSEKTLSPNDTDSARQSNDARAYSDHRLSQDSPSSEIKIIGLSPQSITPLSQNDSGSDNDSDDFFSQDDSGSDNDSDDFFSQDDSDSDNMSRDFIAEDDSDPDNDNDNRHFSSQDDPYSDTDREDFSPENDFSLNNKSNHSDAYSDMHPLIKEYTAALTQLNKHVQRALKGTSKYQEAQELVIQLQSLLKDYNQSPKHSQDYDKLAINSKNAIERANTLLGVHRDFHTKLLNALKKSANSLLNFSFFKPTITKSQELANNINKTLILPAPAIPYNLQNPMLN